MKSNSFSLCFIVLRLSQILVAALFIKLALFSTEIIEFVSFSIFFVFLFAFYSQKKTVIKSLILLILISFHTIQTFNILRFFIPTNTNIVVDYQLFILFNIFHFIVQILLLSR